MKAPLLLHHTLLTLLMTSGIVAAAGLSDEQPSVFQAGYEHTGLNSGITGIGANLPPAADALRVDCDMARSGQCALRATVAPDAAYISADAYRAESDTMQLVNARYSTGEAFVYRFSLRLADDWVFDGREHIDIVWQFKRFSSRPDMFVAVKGQALVLRILKSTQLTLLPTMPRGEWVDVELKVRWSDGDAGRVEGRAWLATRQQVDTLRHAGANMWDARPQAAYLKWGLYKPGRLGGLPWFVRRTVWHDDIEVRRLSSVPN